MATKKTPADRFRERLDGLSDAIPEDLRLPSLNEVSRYRLRRDIDNVGLDKGVIGDRVGETIGEPVNAEISRHDQDQDGWYGEPYSRHCMARAER